MPPYSKISWYYNPSECLNDIGFSHSLMELESDQLIHREESPQISPKVEYRLTERGKSLTPILDGMCEWGLKN